MKRQILIIAGAITIAVPHLAGQAVAPVPNRDAPIYQVTVVERTMKAINYQYRSGPTAIDFQGTVLLPKAKGQAIVESKQGRSEIDARFENLTTPQGFGLEYMTYVLWAITPEGRPLNLGEIVPNSSNKASLRVTTDLKAFGLLITAEPHSAVRLPGDVVVAENQIREDTSGKIEQINVSYDLMPRGHYTYQVSPAQQARLASAPKVSTRRYEALLEIYQAQNALAIAKNAGAATYAPNTFDKAQALLDEAQRTNANKNGDSHHVVDSAREAAQTAEDARQIAERRKHEDEVARARATAASAEQARLNAEAAAQQARADADAARSQADAERAARAQAEADAAAARAREMEARQAAQQNAAVATAANTAIIVRDHQGEQDNQKTELRMQLLEQMNGAMTSRDTAWGLMATVSDGDFAGASLRPVTFDPIRRLCAIIATHPGLRVVVEGHSDTAANEAAAASRAEAVKDQLLRAGLSRNIVEVRAMGVMRPIGSNATEAGRQQNRRVEIIISGDAIGRFPFWDRSYTLNTHQGGQ